MADLALKKSLNLQSQARMVDWIQDDLLGTKKA